jgi:hypothetical protein
MRLCSATFTIGGTGAQSFKALRAAIAAASAARLGAAVRWGKLNRRSPDAPPPMRLSSQSEWRFSRAQGLSASKLPITLHEAAS